MVHLMYSLYLLFVYFISFCHNSMVLYGSYFFIEICLLSSFDSFYGFSCGKAISELTNNHLSDL